MTGVGEWSEEQEVRISAESITAYCRAVGEPFRAFGNGAAAPPMFAAVYSAAAIWRVVVATVRGPGPLIHAAQEFEWFVPVRAGDCIFTRARFEADGARGAHRSLRFRSLSHNGRRELVARGLWTILLLEAAL